MTLRWYSVVIDCRDVVAQSRWWADVRRLEALGARQVNGGQDADQVSWVVMADPEGNEFCILSPRN
jgi:predicted enzyme related to lactoylglutathione lyase